MHYFSLNKQSPPVSFREATIVGQAPDKGLYFPGSIPAVDINLIRNIESYSNEKIGFEVLRPYVGNTIPDEQLHNIISETVNFPIPLIPIHENVASLELFHGNTLAFKDVGARFMSRCLGYFVRDYDKKVTVLVATSGDTGSAVADGFYNVAGIDVIILYPSGKVSSVQEKQLTTHGNNITALEVKGTFDDCQQMVKNAFADEVLHKKLTLTSANSINVARWLPQQLFYYFAYKQVKDKSKDIVIAVPSGNFGNICAGLLAKCAGLPIKHFIAACNANDTVPVYMQTGKYHAKKAVATLSNAMDVGDPSNFIRIQQLFNHSLPSLKEHLQATTINDEATKECILSVYHQYHYLLDPHGAVGYLSLQQYLQGHPGINGIFLETAHPVKFFDVVEPLIGKQVELPSSLKEIMNKSKQTTIISNQYEELRSFILSRS